MENVKIGDKVIIGDHIREIVFFYVESGAIRVKRINSGSGNNSPVCLCYSDWYKNYGGLLK